MIHQKRALSPHHMVLRQRAKKLNKSNETKSGHEDDQPENLPYFRPYSVKLPSFVSCLVPSKQVQIPLRDWSFADFSQQRLIAEGGFGKIFSAFAKPVQTNCVLKAIKLEKTGQTLSVMEVPVECRIQMCSSHNNIVRCWGHFFTASESIIVYDYWQMGDLYSFIHKRGEAKDESVNLINKRAKLFISQITSAITYVQSHFSFIHMDLKPENILVSSHLCVKVTDFGCAIPMKSYRYKHPDQSCNGGTTTYWPPEMFITDEPFDSTVDSWSIACIAYELLTNMNPFFENFQNESSDKIYLKVVSERMNEFRSGKFRPFGFEKLIDVTAITFFRQVFVTRQNRPLVRCLKESTWLKENMKN